jgi:hypothetical protein
VRRVIGAGAGLLFKGEGFYVTDYRSKDYKEKAKSESTAQKPEPKKTPPTGEGSKKAEKKKDSTD